MLSNRDESAYGHRTLHQFDPPRPVLVDMNATLPGGVGRSPIAPARKLYVVGWGVRFEPVMPGRQVAWCQQDTATWWAICDVDVSSANRLSNITVQVWTRAEHLSLDTVANRRRLGVREGRQQPRTG